MSEMTPREIVQELDKHIVGQAAAKRAVAIALRNRWRRMQVSVELRNEITPKNILMIGPTGVGKTEIARRLADLANAPFTGGVDLLSVNGNTSGTYVVDFYPDGHASTSMEIVFSYAGLSKTVSLNAVTGRVTMS